MSCVTRAGGQRYTGAVAIQSDDIGSLWKNVGYNRVEGSIGGPIKGNLTFFVAGTLTGQKSLESEADRDLDRPVFVMSGVDRIPTGCFQPEQFRGRVSGAAAAVLCQRYQLRQRKAAIHLWNGLPGGALGFVQFERRQKPHPR